MEKWLMVGVLTCAPALVMAQSIRCGNKLVSRGTISAEVVARCGDPAQVEHKTEYQSVTASTLGRQNLAIGSTIEVQIELWTYNFGPNKLMQRIRFEDGIVVRIESLGYGF